MINEFLNARYDEDEAIAQAAEESRVRFGDAQGDDAFDEALSLAKNEGAMAEVVDFFRRQTPRFVLADIAAKRAILAWLDQIDREAQQEGLERYWLAGDFDTPPARRILAQPYAEHPDFDPAWRM